MAIPQPLSDMHVNTAWQRFANSFPSPGPWPPLDNLGPEPTAHIAPNCQPS